MKRCVVKTCRAAHYPNFYIINDGEKQIYKYYNSWSDEDFVISPKTAFTISYLASTKAHVQKARLSFKGAESSYNFLHNYEECDYRPCSKARKHNDEDTPDNQMYDDTCEDNSLPSYKDCKKSSSSQSNDSIYHQLKEHRKRNPINRKLLEVAHMRYSLIMFFERHNVNIDELNMYVEIDESIRVNLEKCKRLFSEFSDKHKCSIKGCGYCLVFDGNQKNTRRQCAMKNVYNHHPELGKEYILKVGCPETPLVASTFLEGQRNCMKMLKMTKIAKIILNPRNRINRPPENNFTPLNLFYQTNLFEERRCMKLNGLVTKNTRGNQKKMF